MNTSGRFKRPVAETPPRKEVEIAHWRTDSVRQNCRSGHSLPPNVSGHSLPQC